MGSEMDSLLERWSQQILKRCETCDPAEEEVICGVFSPLQRGAWSSVWSCQKGVQWDSEMIREANRGQYDAHTHIYTHICVCIVKLWKNKL